MRYFDVMAVFIATVWFRSLYQMFIAVAPPAIRTPGFGSRFVSSMHCIIVVIMACLFMAGTISDDSWLWARHITAGYLIHDLDLMWEQPSIRTPADICHHLAFLACLTSAHIDPQLYARGMLSEVSLPFLYTSWCFIKLNRVKVYPRIFWITSIIGAILFFVFRVLNFTQLMWYVWHEHSNVVITAGTMLTVLNYVWFYKLVQKAVQATPTAD